GEANEPGEPDLDGHRPGCIRVAERLVGVALVDAHAEVAVAQLLAQVVEERLAVTVQHDRAGVEGEAGAARGQSERQLDILGRGGWEALVEPADVEKGVPAE